MRLVKKSAHAGADFLNQPHSIIVTLIKRRHGLPSQVVTGSLNLKYGVFDEKLFQNTKTNFKRTYFDVIQRKDENLTVTGFEPAISRFEAERVIRCATRTWYYGFFNKIVLKHEKPKM